MLAYEVKNGYPVCLSATLSSSDNTWRIHLVLRDHSGAHGSGVLDLAAVPLLSNNESWRDFLGTYIDGRTGAIDHQTFGLALHQSLLGADPSIAEAWAAIQANAAGRALTMTVSFGLGTERFAELPLELLHDDSGFCFNRPGSALTRAFAHYPAVGFRYPEDARVLFAWACPPGAGDPIDPQHHAKALTQQFGDRLTILPVASIEKLAEQLEQAATNGDPFQLLHLLAHGSHDSTFGSIALADHDGGLDLVEAQRLANAVRGMGVRLAFLCSCRSGVVGDRTLSGVGQQLLSQAGGDLSAVIATQANLPVHRSAKLAAGFYHQLAARHAAGRPADPGIALARARVLAYQGTRLADAWSVPICLARPAPQAMDAGECARDHLGRSNLPARRGTFQPRPTVMDDILPTLCRHRLVSLVGLPGIGKTELGKEAARALLAEQPGLRVFFQEVNRGLTPDHLRGLLAAALGRERSPESDAELAALLGAEPTLVVLDNAEDMMADAAAQAAFAVQLDAWLGQAPALRILLTTRWLVTGTREREHAVDIPPMTRPQTEALLLAELADSGVLNPDRRKAWSEDPTWERLLDFLDGHPLSVWLVSHHFEGPLVSLGRIVDRLEQARASAVMDPSLIGRADLHDALPEQAQRRMRSLVASIDFSFDVLETRHPEAAAAFLLLSAFPTGLPEPVALAVIASAETAAGEFGGAGLAADRLDQLYRYHLLEWQGHRTFYPVPLRWYAEHKRGRRPNVPAPDLGAALAAYADYIETLNTGFMLDQEPTWVSHWLLEERTLLWLAAEHRPHAQIGTAHSQLAHIAAAARNLLGMAHRLEAWQRLTEAALLEARTIGDRLGEANAWRNLGDLFLRKLQLDEARNAYQRAMTIFCEINDRLGEANTLRSFGDLDSHIHRLDQASDAYQRALTIFQEINERPGEANTLIALGDLFLSLEQLDEARDAYKDALTIFCEINNRLGEANTWNSFGQLFRRREQLKDARNAYQRALTIFREINARLGVASTLIALSELFLNSGELNEAHDACHEALDLYLKIKNRLGEANTRKVLGDLFLRLEQLDEAREAYQDALTIFREINARLSVASTLIALSELFLNSGELNEAHDACHEALDLYLKIKDRLGEANTRKVLGDLFLRLEQLDEAREAYQDALAIFRRSEYRLGEAHTLRALGDLFLRLEQLDEARDAYKDALTIFRQIENRPFEAETLKSLGLLALTDRDAESAFRRFAELPAIYETIHDRSGMEAALGYMARAAFCLGQADRALLLAGEALQIGREIDDRFGQTITLELILLLFQDAGDKHCYQAALAQYRELLAQIQDSARLGKIESIWQQVEEHLSRAELDWLRTEARVLLEAALATVRERFGHGDLHRLD